MFIFRIFSESFFFIAFLSLEIAASINIHVPLLLSRIMMSVLLLWMVLSVVVRYLALIGSVMWLPYLSDLVLLILVHAHTSVRRSQWPRGLRRRPVAARLLGLWFRIPPGSWTFVVSVVCCPVEVPATSWSLVQRSPADCGASCVI